MIKKSLLTLEVFLSQESMLRDRTILERVNHLRMTWTRAPITKLACATIQAALKHTYKSNTQNCLAELLFCTLAIVPFNLRIRAMEKVIVTELREYYALRTKASGFLIESLLKDLLEPFTKVSVQHQQQEVADDVWLPLETSAMPQFSRLFAAFVSKFKEEVYKH